MIMRIYSTKGLIDYFFVNWVFCAGFEPETWAHYSVLLKHMLRLFLRNRHNEGVYWKGIRSYEAEHHWVAHSQSICYISFSSSVEYHILCCKQVFQLQHIGSVEFVLMLGFLTADLLQS